MIEELRRLKEKYVNAKSDEEKDWAEAETLKLADKDGEQWANAMLELARETADKAEAFALRYKDSKEKEKLQKLSATSVLHKTDKPVYANVS
jgi:hypothetical protein